jgi:hypothetical protein
MACDADGVTWREETCPVGCFAGECRSDACADECSLGQQTELGSCRLWDLASASFVEPNPIASTHDRARGYEARLQRYHQPEGHVATVHFTDSTHTVRNYYDGSADSALWTGSALAAEAWRYSATGSPDAANRIAAIAATPHRAFGVTGVPGYLARFVFPTDSSEPFGWNCGDTDEVHCNVTWEGRTYNWKGSTSRDQYTGVMLGLWLGYRATHDEAVKAQIRADVVTLAQELMKVRNDMPVTLNLNGIPLEQSIDLENVILTPTAEMPSGQISITLDTADLDGSGIHGVREFLPDWGTVLQQIPLLSWLPSIPRAGSAMMLAAFLHMAREMTDGVPGFEDEHAAIVAYIAAREAGWIDLAEGWSYGGLCGDSYFAIHISYIMAYAWATLATDPAHQARIRDEVLGRAMWDSVSDEKNAYFAFLWGGTRASPDSAAIGAAIAQLAQFPPAPRVDVAVDRLADYPHSLTCTTGGQPQSTVAVDVGHRIPGDFQWQRHPWGLVSGGNPLQAYPGVDYLAAYWAARHHGFLADDRPGTCARLSP